jgi:hypothetical protein
MGNTVSVKLPNPIFRDIQEESKVYTASYAKRQSSSARLHDFTIYDAEGLEK